MGGKTAESVMTREVNNLSELRLLASDFLRGINGRPPQLLATIVTLSGELGAGKTAFTKQVADLLGIQETVTSPTFILEKIYQIPFEPLLEGKFTRFVHIDAYRLDKGTDLKVLDFDILCTDPTCLIFLEWPERVVDGLPENTVKLSFKHVNESVRLVHVEGLLL